MNKNFTNIACYLSDIAKRRPHHPAVVVPRTRDSLNRPTYTHYTFKQLDIKSNAIANGLLALGYIPGSRVVVMIPPSLEFFSVTFALLKAGIAPILVDPGIGIKNLTTCLSESQPHGFIGIPKAHIARRLFSWGKKTISYTVTVGKNRLGSNRTLSEIIEKGSNYSEKKLPPTNPDTVAAILFTSGSTGVPKGVVYRHRHFVAQVQMIKQAYSIQPGEIDCPTFPPFALFDPALGMTAIIPDMDPTKPANVNPKNIIESIEHFGVTNMFGSPALMNRLGKYCHENNITLPTLKRIISAGAPASPKTLQYFKSVLNPGVQIHTPYGATESLPTCTIGSDEILNDTKTKTDLGYGVCVGRPIDGIDINIIKITDSPIHSLDSNIKLPQGEVGEITVTGKPVTFEYFNRNSSTQLAKIKDHNTIHHRMGDLGYIDDKNRLWFCGRKAHRLQIDSDTLFTVPTESIFNTHPAVYRSALVKVTIKGKDTPVICIELEPEHKSINTLALIKELRTTAQSNEDFFNGAKKIDHFLIHPSFPVDIRHNSKIFREKLAHWAQRKLQ